HRKLRQKASLVAYFAVLQVNSELIPFLVARASQQLGDLLFTQRDRQKSVFHAVIRKDIGKRGRNDHAKSIIGQCPYRVLARRPAAKILSGYQDGCILITRLVEHERFLCLSRGVFAPIVKNKFSETRLLNPLQKLLGNDLVGIDIGAVQRRNQAGMNAKWFHYRSSVEMPAANVREMSGDRGGRGHHGTHQVRASSAPLPPFKVAVAGGGATLARLQDVRIHAQAHRAPRFPPLKARLEKDLVEPFLLRR